MEVKAGYMTKWANRRRMV